MFRRTAKPRAYHVMAHVAATITDLTYTTAAGPLTAVDLDVIRNALRSEYREKFPNVLVEPPVVIVSIFELGV